MQAALFQSFLKEYFRGEKFQLIPLPQSGSDRQNFIVEAQHEKYILTFNPKIDENLYFFYLSESFHQLGINVPKIFKINDKQTLYLQEFLGAQTLSQLIDTEGHTPRIKELVRKTLIQLSNFQQITRGKIDFSHAYEFQQYDSLPIIHDLYYFKNFFADVLGIAYPKGRLLKEFQAIAEEIMQLQPQVVMLRDFQSRNIMVGPQDKISFIDYQGAMQGPATYDVVSFLYQARANFPLQWQEELLALYLQHNRMLYTDATFTKSLNYCKLIRFLQVLGAYGFRGLVQKKEHFLRSIPKAIKNISELASQWDEMQAYPHLSNIISQLQNIDNKHINTIIEL